jgi:hypothetical protein
MHKKCSALPEAPSLSAAVKNALKNSLAQSTELYKKKKPREDAELQTYLTYADLEL